MMNDERPAGVTVESLLAKFSQTSYGELLHDDQRRRHLLATMMAGSTNPIVKEIGEQLRDGVITPRQLLSVPEYWEELQHGYQGLAEVDLDEMDQQVDQLNEQEREEADAAAEELRRPVGEDRP